MSHQFSSTFDALQAHFTQKPSTSQPDDTVPSSQPQNPSSGQSNGDSTHGPENLNSDNNHVSKPARTLLPGPPSRVSVPGPEYPPVQPNPPLYPQFGSIVEPPKMPQTSGSNIPGLDVMREWNCRPILEGPPTEPVPNYISTKPPVPAFTMKTPHGETTRPQSQLPTGSQQSPRAGELPQVEMSEIEESEEEGEDESGEEEEEEEEDEEEGEPMDTTTDALLERQNELNKENPLPPLPPMRGFARKYFMGDDKPRLSVREPRGGRGARKRGPRRAAEPTGDIKYRLNLASNAYMDGRLDEAIEYVEDAIRINGETHRAWVLLASFLQEKGDTKKYYIAKIVAATLQPKDIDGWLQCAEICIELRDEFPDEAEAKLGEALFFYSTALRVDPTNKPARHGRAALRLELGHLLSAAKDYVFLLDNCAFDIYALRSFAEVCVLLADTGKSQLKDRPKEAISAYSKCITHFRENGFDLQYPFDWEDVKIVVELLVYIEQFKDAIHELRSLSRWLLTRSDEQFWDNFDDDREWDVESTRRLETEEYQHEKYPDSSYGMSLPLELRTKLAICRLKLEQKDEAMCHLGFIDPENSNVPELLSEYPHLVLEGASALYETGHLSMALRYYEPLQAADLLDTEALVRQGRCYLDAGDQRQAEECFTAAIDQDETNSEACIDARYELAKMYEAVREEREAFILVNEAIKLQEARQQAREEREDNDEDLEDDDENATLPMTLLGDEAKGKMGEKKLKQAKPKRLPKTKAEKPKQKPKERKPKLESNAARRRHKVFARAEELQLEEKRRSEELAEAWQVVRDSRVSSEADAKGPSNAFMFAARELVDDFRSYKDLYPWEKYLANLGIHQAREKAEAHKENSNLLAMADRLSHNLNPDDPNSERQLKQVAVSYRGVPFDEWLDLLLEYAIGLAQTGKFQDAYKVCESARDATVYSKSKEDMFLIHVTWAACALRGRDEETCVASARWLMREYQFDTDPYRMFSAISRLCPSPASWYASGPVQKYMLRQIKLMDRAITKAGETEDSGDDDGPPSGRVYPSKELDITLLMLYGHILFISNSFTYALNYFMRAYSLDPSNPLVILSVGHCYIHYALKRQSENRQYLLTQGFYFLHEYYNIKSASPSAAQRQEAHYNMARSYHAVGIPHLAADYYRRALREVPDDSDNGIMGRNDLTQEAAYNLQQICWAGGDMDAVKDITDQYLVL